MSRYAYPASSAREDVSFHGSADAREEMKKIIAKEIQEGRMVGVAYLGGQHLGSGKYRQGCLQLCGGGAEGRSLAQHVRVLTVNALTGEEGEESPPPSDNEGFLSAHSDNGHSEGDIKIL